MALRVPDLVPAWLIGRSRPSDVRAQAVPGSRAHRAVEGGSRSGRAHRTRWLTWHPSFFCAAPC